MKIRLIVIGKTDEKNIEGLIEKYKTRLQHYTSFELMIIPDIKNRKSLTEAQQKEAEAKLLLQKIHSSDFTVLLDEKGKSMRSIEFSHWIQKLLNAGTKQLNLIIGGPYGFSPAIYEIANQKLSLSAMTFSHQMIRLFFVEQLYRAFTIINNENYHHE